MARNILNKLLDKRITQLKAKAKTKTLTAATPTVDDPTLQTWIKEVSSTVKDIASSGVRRSDLVRAGIATITNGELQNALSPPEEVNLTVPAAVLNLTANGAYSSNTLTWEKRPSKLFGQNNIYRSDVDDFGTATHIGSTLGDVYTDYVGNNIKAYYWVRTISKFGVEGELSPSVYAETAIDVAYVMEQIEGQINESHLNQILRGEINSISQIQQDLLAEAQARADAILAEAQARVTALNNLAATLDNKVTAVDGRVTATNSDVTALTGRVSTAEGNLSTKADVSAVNALTTRVGNVEGGLEAASNSITSLESSIADKADASAISTLDTQVTNIDGVVNSHATQLTQLITSAGNNTTKITEQTQTIDGIKGIKTVTIDNNGVLFGYGLVSELVNGQVTSSFGVNADTFFIGAPSNNKKPFAVLGSSGEINGVIVPAGTYIDTAYIANGTITNAQIGNLSADKITAGNIAADRMKANIVAAVSGQFTELSAITGTIGVLRTATSGARTEIKDNLIEVFDSAGRVRVRLGVW